MFQSLQQFFNDTPKAHFLGHYSQLLKFYKGLERFSTIRFERKHADVKRLVLASKNYRNLVHSLAYRHQEQQAIVLLNSNKKVSDAIVPPNLVEFAKTAEPLRAAENPFPLKANIVRRVIGDQVFIEVKKFFLVNQNVFLFGCKWELDNEKLANFSAMEDVVKPIKKTQEEFSLSLAEVWHINNFKFRLSDQQFVNITV